jgi:hypothetical protein
MEVRAMREVVTETFLKLIISARLADVTMGAGTLWAVPVRCPRRAGGPNWRNSFNPETVPKGYTEAWERIRPEFEARFDLPS